MALRIPPNKIINNYTAGKEYILESTYKEYIGYYYELNNKIFAGKEFNSNAPILLKKGSNSINKLIENTQTQVYGKVSGIKIPQTKFQSSLFSPTEEDYQKGIVIRYFTQKLNINPILIKEINKESYNQIQKDPLYKSISIIWKLEGDNTPTINEAEKQMSGISIFLQDSLNTTLKPDGYSNNSEF